MNRPAKTLRLAASPGTVSVLAHRALRLRVAAVDPRARSVAIHGAWSIHRSGPESTHVWRVAVIAETHGEGSHVVVRLEQRRCGPYAARFDGCQPLLRHYASKWMRADLRNVVEDLARWRE